MVRCKIIQKIQLTLGLLLVLLGPLWAAKKPPLVLSLNDAIMLSLRFSPIVKAADIQRVVDKFNLSVARNQFEFQYALTGFGNQNNSISSGGPLSTFGNYNATPSISRETVYGTKYNLAMSNPVSVSKFGTFKSGNYNPALTLQVLQPLIQGSGREIVESDLNQAINSELTTEIAYKAAIMDKITQIISDYRNVVAAIASLAVAEDGLKASQETIKQNAARIRLGFMAPSENVQAQSFVASQELQVTSAQFTLMSSKLNLLRDMGLSPDTPITVDKTISDKQIPYPVGEEAINLLFANNPQYQAALYQLKNSKISLLQAEDQQRWTLNFTGTVVQGNGSGGNGNSGIASLYNGLNRSRSLGLELNVPIDNLPVQQQLVSAKVAFTQSQLGLKDLRLVLETQLLTTIENLRILYMQVKIAKQAEALSDQSYQDALKKVKFGQSSMFEVTTLQSTYISNRLNTINTEISYLNGVAEYQRLLGITLDEWHVTLQY